MERKSGYTETGKRIVLKEDGAWEYADQGGQAQPSYDFRKCQWGMSKAQVKNLEKSELLKEAKEGLVYSGRVSSFPCFIAYFFAQDRLVRARYNITSRHEFPGGYLEQYGELQSILEKKYGLALRVEQKWWDDLHQDDEASWGKAVALGHLALWSSWETDTSEISLMLRGEEQQIFLEIEYCSKAMADLEDAEEPEEGYEDF